MLSLFFLFFILFSSETRANISTGRGWDWYSVRVNDG